MSTSDPVTEEADRLRAETVLLAHDDLYCLLTDHVTDFIRLHDLDGRSVYASRSVDRLYGKSPTRLFEFAHPEDLEAGERWWHQVLAGGTEQFRWRVRSAGGERWVETNASLVSFQGTPHVLTVCRDITDRKRVEEASRRSEEQLRLVIDAIPVMAWTLGPDGIVDFLNRRWTDYSGLSLEQFSADPTNPIHPADVEHVVANWREKIAAGVAYEDEMRLRRFDGEYRWFLVLTAPVRDERSRVVKWYGVSIDIQDRKQAAEALRESERRLYESQRIAHLGHWEQDLESGRLTASDETYRIFGLAPQEGLKSWESWQEFVHPEDRQDCAAAIARALREGSRYEAEYRVIRPDGDIRIVHSQGEVERDESGRPRRVFGTMQDITEQRSNEQARRAAEQRLEHVVASSPAVLFIMRIEDGELQRMSWMSANVEAMLGYQVDDTLSPGWWMNNVHSDDRDAVRKHFLSDMLSRGDSADEYRFRHRDGHYRWLRGEARLLLDAAGQPVEVVGSLSDITERRRLEDQFRQSQKMEAVGHLAGGVAHDFNNTLTVISTYSEILLRGMPSSDPKREMVSAIREAGERATGLTRQLLAFSRQTVLEPKVLDLNELVLENEKMLRRIIGEDVQLVTKLESVLGLVQVDPAQLGHVVVNLAVNARDAMPTGGRLTIETDNVALDETFASLTPETRPGRYVMLAVSDTGTGMSPEVRSHIFDPFFTTKSPGKGTGLGLAMVYGFVKQSGGRITVDSEPGQGTVFKLFFPVVGQSAASWKSLPGLKPLERGTETILLVEDEDAVRSMVQLVLKEAGYNVIAANGGHEALQLAGEHTGALHILITDVVMPEMGGRELAERLTLQRSDLKVLYLSGYTADDVLRHGVLQAEVAFLQKPFTMAALTNKVREVLDSSS